MSKFKWLDNTVRQCLQVVFGEKTILGKQLNDSNMVLYYNQMEHLVFLGKSKITYEQVLQNKVKKYIHVGDTVFDIGANIGQYALLFSDLVGKNGKVISFEPDSRNFAYLLFNKWQNNCLNLLPQQEGVGSKTGEIEIYTDTLTGGRRSSMRKDLMEEGTPQQTKICTLTEAIERFGVPQFIKIDVEGFEIEVLNGAKSASFNEKIVWLIEVRTDTKAAIFQKLSATHSCFVADNMVDVLVEKETAIPDFANLLFVPKSLNG